VLVSVTWFFSTKEYVLRTFFLTQCVFLWPPYWWTCRPLPICVRYKVSVSVHLCSSFCRTVTEVRPQCHCHPPFKFWSHCPIALQKGCAKPCLGRTALCSCQRWKRSVFNFNFVHAADPWVDTPPVCLHFRFGALGSSQVYGR
jgi:hypothetical protein